MRRPITEKGIKSARTGSTFAERLIALKGEASYHQLARDMQAAGLKVTAQGLHKYTHGGGASPENVKDIARYFGVSPGYLYFGEPFGESNESSKRDGNLSPDARLLGEAWLRMPERFRTPLAVEVFKVALAFTTDEQDRLFRIAVQQALQRIAKGGS